MILSQLLDPETAASVQAALARALAKLSHRERVVMSLFYYEQLTRSEIAYVMDIPMHDVFLLHAAAMETLRETLGE